jgi:hypothetical protein
VGGGEGGGGAHAAGEEENGGGEKKGGAGGGGARFKGGVQWLTGGLGATVTAAGVKRFKPFPNSNCSKQFQMFSNFG